MSQEDSNFDCILLDAQMPNILDTICSDNSFTIKIRKPVIMMLSTSTHRTIADRKIPFSILRFVNKPIGSLELYNALLQVLNSDIPPIQKEGPEAVSNTSSIRQPLHVLLAEDNVINQKVAIRMLETKFGFKCTLAQNGLEAIEASKYNRYDIILMDISMPYCGGFEACAQIREYEKTIGIHTPIIALTAHAISGYREKCLENQDLNFEKRKMNRSCISVRLNNTEL